MDVRTFTTFWNQEKKLYSINDIALPFAIPLRTLGVFVLTALPWWILMGAILHVPFDGGVAIVIYFGPPALVGWLGSRPIFEGKSLFQFARSHLLYWLTETRHWKGVSPNHEGAQSVHEAHYRVYRRQR